ncbi:MAG: ubiquinone biosynthesis protein [Bacteroidota bacterium]|nr:ubiquinone biosynthesis protein [Bacteroidota bacterium]
MLSIKRISVAGVFYRHIGRFRTILNVLIKYGFSDILNMLKINHYLKIGNSFIFRKRAKELKMLSRPERIRKAIEELGTTFIKLGQIISTRPDLIPPEYINELSKLQDSVPVFSFDSVKKIIYQELGKNIEDIFLEFDANPIAAASIGQVHKAKLKSGTMVVVKVQRPGIRQIIEIDLEILMRLAKLAEKNVEEFEFHKPVQTLEEFSRTLMKELNYLAEASNIEQFSRYFKDDPNIVVPKVFREFSSEKALVMEYIDGIKISDMEQLKSGNYNLKLIAARGAEFIIKQVFVHGFFHADPHPGNIFILKENRICFIDYGMTGRISRKEREDFTSLIMSIISKDEKKTVESILKLTNNYTDIDKNELEKDFVEFIDRYLFLPMKDLNIGRLLFDLIDILTRHALGFKPHLFLMMKALSCMDEIARALDPDFEVIKHTEPIIEKIQIEKFSPENISSEFIDYGTEMVKFIREFPVEISNLVKLASEGKLKFEFHHRDLDELIITNKRITNRLSFSLILASIIVGSSLIVLSGVPPKWHDISIIGLSGFVISALMGIWLLLSGFGRE